MMPPAPVATPGPAAGTALASLAGCPVLFISEATAFGGHESMALRAAAGLSKGGVPTTFRFWRGNDRLRRAIEQANAQGASVQMDDTAAHDVRLGSLRTWHRGQAIRATQHSLARDTSFARVLVQGRIDSGLVTLSAASQQDRPLISYLPMAHTLRQMGVRTCPGLREHLLARLYAMVPAYITIDAGVERDLRARGAKAPVAIVDNWVPEPPVTQPDRHSARQRLGLTSQRPMVATIGRVDFRQKGHDHFLRAMATPEGRSLELDWLVVGDGPDAATLKSQIEAAGLSERCHLLPWVEGGMDDVYAAVDAVVLPSNFEGVPLVMLEALARGLPVAGSAIDGMASWLPAAVQFDRYQPTRVLDAVRQALSPACRQDFQPAFKRASAATDVTGFVEAWAHALQSLVAVKNR